MDLQPFRTLVKQRSGLSFEAEKAAKLADGVRARMSLRGMASDAEYLSCLTGDEDEFHCLVSLLTINETFFFREPVHLDLLADRLMGEMLAARTPGDPIRIFCAGCSTGEEPYSVMMKLLERYGTGIQGLISIIGADIDSDALGKAEQGIYSGLSFRGFPHALREKYFEAAGRDRYRIGDVVREKIRFMKLNLMDDAYADALRCTDVIFYRNVSIYFEPETQRSIFDKLAGLLKEKGWLFVSSTETLSHNHGVLSLVERDGIFCYQKNMELALGDRRKPATKEHAHHECMPPPPLPPVRCIASNGAGNPVTSHKGRGYGERRPSMSAAEPPSRALSSSRGISPVLPAATRPAAANQGFEQSRAERSSFDDALALAKGKNYEQALALVDGLLERDPSFTKGCMLKAGILINLKRLEEAGQVCRQSLERDRWCLEGHLLLGLIARLGNDHDAALQRFKEAVYIQSSCWLAHFYLAEIHCLRGDGGQAAREYEIVVNLLKKGDLPDHGLTFFPLAFSAEQFMHLCRHNLEKLEKARSS